MSRPLIHPGHLIWSGEHWLTFLRTSGSDIDTAAVSIYHTRYSAGGEGTVAFVKFSDNPEANGAYTDNPEVAQYVYDHRLPFDRTLPLVEAVIERGGDIRHNPSWSIRSSRSHIVTTWTELGPPLVVEGVAPIFRDEIDFFALFVFAETASVTLNGVAIPGMSYPVDVWAKTLGGDRSACMFALAETLTRVLPGSS